MKVRTFHVKSMHEAIRSIKDTLGPDAVILSTKRVRSWDNGFGLLGGSVLEVMAAIEDDAAVPAPAPFSLAVSILVAIILLRLLSSAHNTMEPRMKKCPAFRCKNDPENCK